MRLLTWISLIGQFLHQVGWKGIGVNEVNGGMVHEAYWQHNRLQEIAEYCEKDVNVLIDFIKKLKELK